MLIETTPRPNYSTFIMKNIKEITADTWSTSSYVIALSLSFLLSWAIGYALFGSDVFGLNSPLIHLVILFVAAKVLGYVFGLVRIPPMVGMLLAGILFQNVGLLEMTKGYLRFTALLRQLALVIILLPAGLGLDANVLSKMYGMILSLAVVPVAIEVISVAVLAKYIIEMPWLWSVLLGILLSAVSPAVVIPCLFELQDRGFGVEKGIHTLVIAASTVNDIISVALFGVFIGIIFSTGSLTMQILQGPICFVLGFAFGIFWGIVCIYVPSTNEKYKTTLRTMLLGLGCIASAFCSDALGYGGAGVLGCIVAAFVAAYGWKKQGWSASNPVKENFVILWKFFEPISFSLIGMEVKFEILDLTTVLWGVIIILIPLLTRISTSFGVSYFGDFNIKEHTFIALSWIPKATVQAALGPVALDYVRSMSKEELLPYANAVVIIAVASILLTSPIGAVLIMELGPRLLKQRSAEVDDNLQSTDADNQI